MVPCEVRQDIYAALTLLTLTRRFSNRCESDLNGGEVGLRVVGKETGALFLQQTGAISESVARTLAGLSSRIQHERRGRNHLRESKRPGDMWTGPRLPAEIRSVGPSAIRTPGIAIRMPLASPPGNCFRILSLDTDSPLATARRGRRK